LAPETLAKTLAVKFRLHLTPTVGPLPKETSSSCQLFMEDARRKVQPTWPLPFPFCDVTLPGVNVMIHDFDDRFSLNKLVFCPQEQFYEFFSTKNGYTLSRTYKFVSTKAFPQS
jgi:hypothetical protein